MIKSILRKIVPLSIRKLRHPTPPSAYLECYSQEGEDMVLRRFFEGRTNPGFYVDVGAHHPMRFSNTYFFYRQGWSGINVDAMPGSMEPFKTIRPRDINLEHAVSDRAETLTYTVFNDKALNGFDQQLAAERDNKGGFYITDRIPITTCRLAEILDKWLPVGTSIDFLTVDVEGLDLQVLRSNNWEKYRPTLVLAEDIGAKQGLDHVAHSSVTEFLAEQGYRPFASTGFTVIYQSAT